MNLKIQLSSIALLLFLLITTNCWCQPLSKGLIFNSDLNSLSQFNSSNLIPINDDKVRAMVVKFAPNKEAHTINYERDTAISVSFWIRPQNIHLHHGAIFGEQDNFYFRYLANKQFQFNLWQRIDVETPAVVTENQWQHVGFTLNKLGQLNIYFNGDLLTRDSIPSDWWVNKGQAVVGKDRFDVAAEGFMDELKVWNRTLLAKEMQEEYSRSILLPPLNYGLKLFLPLKEDLRNLSDNKIELSTVKNISFSEDSRGRNSANFKLESSHAKITNITFDNQKTIALWIKTGRNNRPVALIGNSDFCMRYLTRTGRIMYSVPMQYGLKSQSYTLPTNEWIHLAVGVNYNHKIDYYINGEKIDSTPIEAGTGNANYIEIGKSIWNDYYEGRMSEIAIWDRKLSDVEIKEVYNGKIETLLPNKTSDIAIYLILIFIVLTLSILFILLKQRTSRKRQQKSTAKKLLPKTNAIYFLQLFKAYNKQGVDFSSEFSPTLIRLFALILIYPEVYHRNISSSEMSDILWPSESPVQQKNNRSTNVHRLRSIFKQIPGLELNYQNKTWKIINPDHIFIDIQSIDLLLKQLNYKSPLHSINLDKRVLSDEFDTIIRLYNDKRLETLADKCSESKDLKDWNHLAYLSKLWLSIDTLSDEAIKYQVSALLQLDQKQNALNAFEVFCKNYTLLLNEDYPVLFEQLS